MNLKIEYSSFRYFHIWYVMGAYLLDHRLNDSESGLQPWSSCNVAYEQSVENLLIGNCAVFLLTPRVLLSTSTLHRSSPGFPVSLDTFLLCLIPAFPVYCADLRNGPHSLFLLSFPYICLRFMCIFNVDEVEKTRQKRDYGLCLGLVPGAGPAQEHCTWTKAMIVVRSLIS